MFTFCPKASSTTSSHWPPRRGSSPGPFGTEYRRRQGFGRLRSTRGVSRRADGMGWSMGQRRRKGRRNGGRPEAGGRRAVRVCTGTDAPDLGRTANPPAAGAPRSSMRMRRSPPARHGSESVTLKSAPLAALALATMSRALSSPAQSGLTAIELVGAFHALSPAKKNWRAGLRGASSLLRWNQRLARVHWLWAVADDTTARHRGIPATTEFGRTRQIPSGGMSLGS